MAVGWASGIKHAVAGSPYAAARAATFAGKSIFERARGRQWDFAAEIPPSLFYQHADSVPEIIRGDRFASDYGDINDPLSRIDPKLDYRARACLRFAIEESFRSELVVALMSGARGRNRGEHLRQVGELMLQSHAGYSSIGLGAPETDAMIDALRQMGPDQGVYGGRASGGGSGGAVVVLLEKSALDRLRDVANKLQFNGTGTTLILGKE